MTNQNVGPVKNPFEYQKPSEKGIAAIERVRRVLAQAHTEILASVPPGRERALAVTKLEEASMWANKGIAFGEDM